MENHQEWRDLSRESLEIWDHNAEFWDEYMGEGNDFQRILLAPTMERLLDLKHDELVLEIACGNGNFARRMAQLGARVVALDGSSVFVDQSRKRTTEHANRIEYHVIDATDSKAMGSLGEGVFDAAVCNMAIMDIPTIEPLLEAVASLLKPEGRFVFTVTHPCFNTSGITKIVEQEDHDGELVTTYAIKINSYISPRVSKGLGVIGQPEPQYYFDRPLSMLLNQCFESGFVLDRFEEPVFSSKEETNRRFSWNNFLEIPPVIAARMRRVP